MSELEAAVRAGFAASTEAEAREALRRLRPFTAQEPIDPEVWAASEQAGMMLAALTAPRDPWAPD